MDIMAPDQRVTAKGAATRGRIVIAAADLICLHGVGQTSMEDIRRDAQVSGSQLTHYFANKETLLRAVLEWRAIDVISVADSDRFDRLRSLRSLRDWVDSYVASETSAATGCSYGSLAAELMKSGIDIRAVADDGFSRWEAVIAAGIEAMKQRGEIRSDAQSAALAQALMASFQGGMLLSMAAGHTAPLAAATAAALGYIETFTIR